MGRCPPPRLFSPAAVAAAAAEAAREGTGDGRRNDGASDSAAAVRFAQQPNSDRLEWCFFSGRVCMCVTLAHCLVVGVKAGLEFCSTALSGWIYSFESSIFILNSVHERPTLRQRTTYLYV